MRTTLDIDSDVLDAAKILAEAQRTSVGKALSQIARRGLVAQSPVEKRNGFTVFALGKQAREFGPDDVRAAIEAEDLEAGRGLINREG